MNLELLPYLWKTLYMNSFMEKGGYTIEMLALEAEAIPVCKRIDAINFCIRCRLHLNIFTDVFRTITKLKSIGANYDDKHYDRYYNNLLNYKEILSKQVKKFEELCTNPEMLQPILDAIHSENSMLIPLPRPSTMIYETIRKNEIINKHRTDFLKIFDMVQSSEGKKLTNYMNFKIELFNASGLGFGVLKKYTPPTKK